MLFTNLAQASSTAGEAGPRVGGVPIAFILFACVLVGVALLHKHTMQVAVTGLVVITAFKLAFGFDLLDHLLHEWVVIANLFGLLCGFALLADHFEKTNIPNVLPRWLPDNWTGGLALLVMVFVISSFLDNIAAAMIGGTVARIVFKGRVHIGFLAAIVAASNAGGCGSVVGDTTTTMMWIAGKSPLDVLHGYIAAVPALLVCGTIASVQQDRYQRISKDEIGDTNVDYGRVGIVAALLGAAVAANVLVNMVFSEWSDSGPWIALALWAAILATSPVRPVTWTLLPDAAKGAVFLLSLVLCASMMPVSELPTASWKVSLGLGFLSAGFDNIPLTALALKQGGYDWGMLAYAVGFGGSMIWFGSSAGVALSNTFPEAKNAVAYVKNGWHVTLAYVIGFFTLYALWGFHPN